MTLPHALEVVAVPWPEVRPGADLVGLVLTSVSPIDGDILVLTSKVLSKSEGASEPASSREDLINRETVRVVARRGSLRVVETRHGLVMAAAGVDSSNTAPGTALALPRDPDATARTIREAVAERTGANVAVVVTDTIGRAWRLGQTDHAIGCAGILPVQDLVGQPDGHGNTLLVTAPAVADEIAGAADLVKGKTSGRPLAVVRGLAPFVLPIGHHGPGLGGLVRPRADDLFALGARDAVIAAVRRDDPGALAAFALPAADDPDPFDAVVAVPPVELSVVPEDRDPRGWAVMVIVPERATAEVLLQAGRTIERVRTLAAAHRLTQVAARPTARPPDAGRTVVDRSGWVTS